MALPKSYLTTGKNLTGILEAIKSAQAPTTFTTRFLASLGFTSPNDRLVIGVLQSLGFLSTDKKPTDRYYKFLDQTQSAIVLADAMKEAYADLFQINKNAQSLSKTDVLNKFKTLSQGQYSESVLDKMAFTFGELAKRADFQSKVATEGQSKVTTEAGASGTTDEMGGDAKEENTRRRFAISGLHYNINLILPESRDAMVYDVLFRSLKEHLL